MALISGIYHNQLSIKTDIKKNKANSSICESYYSKLAITYCHVCHCKKASKRLSKKDRAIFKRKYHPICNECRDRLTKTGLYSQIRQQVINKLNYS